LFWTNKEAELQQHQFFWPRASALATETERRGSKLGPGPEPTLRWNCFGGKWEIVLQAEVPITASIIKFMKKKYRFIAYVKKHCACRVNFNSFLRLY